MLFCTTPSLRKFVHITLCLIPMLYVSTLQAAAPDGRQYVSRADLVNLLAAETGLPVKVLRTIMKDATFRPDIIESMNKQWEALPYARYRPLFIKQSMDDRGKEFLAANRATFTAVEQKYQVDSAIVAGILGIETRFGGAHGNKPILDSLYTLSTGFPRRADFFRQQLGAIIQISRQDKLDLKELKGSYAGAFGSIQFIPTSFRDFAVDEDGDGVRDVFHSQQDITGSIANYFHKHGWQYGRPVAHWLPIDTKLNSEWKKIAAGKLENWVTLADLRKAMPKIFNTIPLPWLENDKVSIIEMETDKGKQLALVHYNFRVIMRYNPSYNYAMAVTEIAAMWESKKFAVE
ncbi:MAG: lytic murein transglycosylase [Zetaproteobacteria bacterium CG_4_9_14_3_um_filter_53_7]|nr:MAG: lytic murein transglycosylase [Zetaproteobacteria bacterium CG_4_9_14_3_um_filter_53_7]